MRWTRVPLALVTIVGALQIVTPIRGAVPEATASADVTEGEAGTAPAADYLEKYSRPFRIDTREFRYTETYYWRRLSHPTADDRRLGGAVLAVAFALWSGKDEIQRDMAQRDTPVEHQAALKTIEKLGGGAVVPATALLMYVGGSAFRDYRAKQTGVMLAHSLLLTDLVTLAGRWALAEDRPKYGGSLHPFHGVGGGISGHSATAASISGVLSRMYLQAAPEDSGATVMWKRVGKGFAYGLPVLVAFGRINDQQHYLYNTVLGLSIGFWSGHVVADAHGLYIARASSRLRPSTVGPITNDRGAPGIGARWVF